MNGKYSVREYEKLLSMNILFWVCLTNKTCREQGSIGNVGAHWFTDTNLKQLATKEEKLPKIFSTF